MVEQEQPLLDAFIDVYMSSLKYLDEFISEPAQAFHLSFEQYLILREITQNDQVTLMDIASKRQVTRSAISRQIKVLLKAGYLQQQPDENDRRRLYLLVTPTGAKAERAIRQRINQRFQGWLDVYGDQRAREILDFIRDFSQVTQMKK
ncbi:MarR family transcriptional regulator [Levilactobacillus brevis]|uniref:MarR family transcriptional regulator n=1 Tax=Levilactobacillus brevis TaxID=1580 RepID=A0AAJ5K8F1_LEVBR|nr:MarR family transcriptional regulator [Levilactobacillus brevis]AWP46152.1 MarR family transcriptional regulator [Levilactobacillus brevis]MBS1005231.1 MarR family transcriptional regulator [Levilactobacillus brevis]MBS1012794.1 MarR family transcriptional regulator [Levilactobacillus brevis]MCT3567981.1 MarR family transcriptional regulator [Levilactobacillus brevis]RAY10118.1 MarR family transcriptional regulator [Levilactobacillus brevis]